MEAIFQNTGRTKPAMTYLALLDPFKFTQVQALQEQDAWCMQQMLTAKHMSVSGEGDVYHGVGGLLFQQRGT